MFTHTEEALFVPLSFIVFPLSLLQDNCSLKFLMIVMLLLFCFSPVVWFGSFTTHYAALSANLKNSFLLYLELYLNGIILFVFF